MSEVRDIKFYVYSLICPLSNEVKYIGVSINPKSRYSVHLSEKSNKRKKQWIDELKFKNLKPIMNIIDEFEEINKASDSEAEHIKMHSETILNGRIQDYKYPENKNILKGNDISLILKKDDYNKLKTLSEKSGRSLRLEIIHLISQEFSKI